MRNVFNHLLVVLCVVDLMVILTNIVTAGKAFLPQNLLLLQIAPWSDGFCHISVSASVFLTVAITMERYYAVCFPHTYQTRLAGKGHWCIIMSNILPVFFAAILFNMPKILQLTRIVSLAEIFPDTRSYIKVGIISQVFHPLVTTCVIPILMLSFLNLSILRGSRKKSQSRAMIRTDITMAKTMMTIVTVFIILNIPRMVLALYEVSTIPDIVQCYERNCYYYLSSRRWVMDILVRYLVMLNSSINFIIYCFVGSNFRNTLKQVFIREESIELNLPVRSSDPSIVSTSNITSTNGNLATSCFGGKTKISPLETQINFSDSIVLGSSPEENDRLISSTKLPSERGSEVKRGS